MKNWRTSLAGIVAILTAVLKLGPDVSTNLQNPEIIAIVAAGIGLILSKDSKEPHA